MIVVPVKEGENIEKALKKFKRKFEKTGTVKELRRRQQFDKPSVTRIPYCNRIIVASRAIVIFVIIIRAGGHSPKCANNTQ